jgi:hypothetical protein
MYSAINKGLKLARGEILAYLNADDTYFPWTLEVITEAFQANPSVDFLFGDLAFFNEQSGKGSVRIYPGFNREAMKRSLGLPQPTAFWHRSIYDRFGGFDEKFRIFGDREYWMRWCDSIEVMQVREILAADSLRGDALRFNSAGQSELKYLRTHYGRMTGLRKLYLRPFDIARYYLAGQYWLGRFTARALETRLRSARRDGEWARFLNAYGKSLSLRRLALANVLTRRRHWGLGLLQRPGLGT